MYSIYDEFFTQVTALIHHERFECIFSIFGTLQPLGMITFHLPDLQHMLHVCLHLVLFSIWFFAWCKELQSLTARGASFQIFAASLMNVWDWECDLPIISQEKISHRSCFLTNVNKEDIFNKKICVVNIYFHSILLQYLILSSTWWC